MKSLNSGASTTGASAPNSVPTDDAPAAAGSHQLRGYRRVSVTTALPAAPASPISIALALTTSAAHPRHDCVTSPTRAARRRASADSGSWSAVTPAAIAAPATAPPSGGEWNRSVPAALRRERAARANAASAPSSTIPRATPRPSWGRANRRPRSICSRLKYASASTDAGLVTGCRGVTSRAAASATASANSAGPAPRTRGKRVTGDTVATMRVAIVSDIHGNRQAFEAVLDAIEASECEEMWCLGDLVGYGADPDACVELARRHAAVCLAGNHDMGVRGDLPLEQFSRGAALAARWTQETIDPDTREYLGQLEP